MEKKKINKQDIALKRKEILDKAEKLKKGIKYKEKEEKLNVKWKGIIQIIPFSAYSKKYKLLIKQA